MTETSLQPLVSIVTPVYNGAEYLPQLIESVLAQDYPNIEHIVIDDGSRDNGETVKVLSRYPSLRWWSRENRGQYATVNEGMREARGEVVTVISADDYYANATAISAAMKCYSRSPGWSGVFGVTVRADQQGRPLPVQPPKRAPLKLLVYYTFLCHCSLFIRRELILRDEMWLDESLRFVGDGDWLVRMVNVGGYRFRFFDHPVAVYRYHDAQLSGDRNKQANTVEHDRMYEKYGASRSLLRLVTLCFSCRHRILKMAWILRNRGIGNLIGTIRLKLTAASRPAGE